MPATAGVTQKPCKQGIGEWIVCNPKDECSQKDCSRNSDSNVPNVYWNPDNGKVKVNWYDVDNANPTNGLRSEVLIKNSDLFRNFLLIYQDKYFIQPFVIFDVSMMGNSIRIYVFSSII